MTTPDSSAAREPAAPKWLRLMDSDWVNIVNHTDVLDEADKEIAVNAAVRLTEARLKELNAASLPSQPAAPVLADEREAFENWLWFSGERVITKEYLDPRTSAAWDAWHARSLLAAGAAPAPKWPDGLLDRIKAAEKRIQDNRAPRTMPADPHSDVDLVLAEVRYLIEGKWPPFWIKDSSASARPAPSAQAPAPAPSEASLQQIGKHISSMFDTFIRAGEPPNRALELAFDTARSRFDASAAPAPAASPAGVQQIAEALEHVEGLCQFAYEQGFHELGYNPVAVLRAALQSAGAPQAPSGVDAQAMRLAEELETAAILYGSSEADSDDEWNCRNRMLAAREALSTALTGAAKE